jgi:hypothetical protein
VVYTKPPFGGPEPVLRYLSRYTHRVAISNHRILKIADGNVTFLWRDYAHGGKKRKMTLPAGEFLRRFFVHVLSQGFVRIRHFGFLANRHRKTLLNLHLSASSGMVSVSMSVCPRRLPQSRNIRRSAEFFL